MACMPSLLRLRAMWNHPSAACRTVPVSTRTHLHLMMSVACWRPKPIDTRTTRSIPRREKSPKLASRRQNECNSLFRKFTFPKPYRSPKMYFCLRVTRVVSSYRCISLCKHEIGVLNFPKRKGVDIHLLPDETHPMGHLRILRHGRMVHSVSHPRKVSESVFKVFPTYLTFGIFILQLVLNISAWQFKISESLTPDIG